MYMLKRITFVVLFSSLGIMQLYGKAGPNAVTDHFEICNNGNAAVFDVLANDVPGCDPDLVIIDTTQPTNGISAIVSGQFVSYLPNLRALYSYTHANAFQAFGHQQFSSHLKKKQPTTSD